MMSDYSRGLVYIFEVLRNETSVDIINNRRASLSSKIYMQFYVWNYARRPSSCIAGIHVFQFTGEIFAKFAEIYSFISSPSE